jgi:YD repeat-containing protein
VKARAIVECPWSGLIWICFLLLPSLAAAQVHQPLEFNGNRAGFGVKAADPFDVGTGIYYRTYLDLRQDDTIPIRFERTQRNQDLRSRSFGIGGSTSYDMFIVGDVDKFSWVALVLADGGQIRYARVSRGTSYWDGVFEDQATPGKFLGSRITWNFWRGNWNVALKDGTQFTIQGYSGNSEPGQCAVTEIKNKSGERLKVKRDGDGNILRVISPNDHFVSVANDSAGRIKRIEDDARHWVSYEYDSAGALVKSRNWRGNTQYFSYDAQFNMTRIEESGTDSKGPYHFTINNTFNEQNRFKGQTVSTGTFSSAEYTTDNKDNVIQVNVRGPEGLSRYFFNELGYETRQEFKPVKGFGWTYERMRNPNSNATIEVVVRCHSATIELPLEFDVPLGEEGELRIAYLSAACKGAESKASPGVKRSLARKGS